MALSHPNLSSPNAVTPAQSCWTQHGGTVQIDSPLCLQQHTAIQKQVKIETSPAPGPGITLQGIFFFGEGFYFPFKVKSFFFSFSLTQPQESHHIVAKSPPSFSAVACGHPCQCWWGQRQEGRSPVWGDDAPSWWDIACVFAGMLSSGAKRGGGVLEVVAQAALEVYMVREGGRRGWMTAGMESWEMGAANPSCLSGGTNVTGLLESARFRMSICW